MADRRINFGESESDARYAVEDDSTTGGDLRVLDVSGGTPAELLTFDWGSTEWDVKQVLSMEAGGRVADDQDLEFGTDGDFKISYHSTSGEWRLRDKQGNQDLFVISSSEILIGNSRDIRLKSGSVSSILDARQSDGHIGIGAAPEDDIQIKLDAPPETINSNQSFSRTEIKASGALTVQGSTTSPVVATLEVEEPNIDASAGGATVTEAASLHITGAPTEATDNYGYLQDAGDMGLLVDSGELVFGAGRDYALRFNESTGGSGAFELVDKANTDVEAKFAIGGGIEFANQTIESKLDQGEDLFKLTNAASSDDARFRWNSSGEFELNVRDDSAASTTSHLTIVPAEAFMRVESDLQFDGLTGTPKFSGHDHSEGGLTAIPNAGLANSSVTVAGNAVSLGGSIAVSVDDLSDVASSTESAGDLPIWNATAGEYQNAALTGGNAISVTNADASVTLAVPTDGIQTDEIDLSIAPTWTGGHTFDGGITMGGNILPDANATRSVGTAATHFNEMHATSFITHSPEPRSLAAAVESIRSYARDYGSMDMAEMIADLVTVVQEQQLMLEEIHRGAGS